MTRMALDPRNGDAVTPEVFITRHGTRFKERGIFPICLACGARLHPYGIHSTRVSARFDHPDGSDCPLSATPDPRFAHLRPSGWDLEAGRRLRAAFCRESNLKAGYAVCHAICYHRLDSAEFVRFCKQADARNIWAYKGLKLEIVPYILVTLADLPVNEKIGRDYPLRFVLHKPVSEPIDALWLSPQACELVPYFADSGNPMTKCRTWAIPDHRAEGKRTDTGWMSQALIERLLKCCLHSAFNPA